MSLREGPFGEIRPPVAWLVAVALIVALIAAAAIFFGDRREALKTGAFVASRQAADTVVAPVGRFLAGPAGWLENAAGRIGDYVEAGSQNQQLRAELIAARSWRDRAMALAQENARYRALLGVRTDPPIPLVFARTVLDARGPFSNSRLADAGSARGVIEGNPVLSDHGLVGRVTGVTAGVSRVLLLTDVESRTPVLIPRTNGRAILTGDGGPTPVLAWLRTHDALREGDRVLTSGDGGVFPRGLPVGSVVRDARGVWRVVLDADAAPIDDVQILLYRDFSQVAAGADLAPKDLPSTATAPPAAPAVTATAPAPAAASPAQPQKVSP